MYQSIHGKYTNMYLVLYLEDLILVYNIYLYSICYNVGNIQEHIYKVGKYLQKKILTLSPRLGQYQPSRYFYITSFNQKLIPISLHVILIGWSNYVYIYIEI